MWKRKRERTEESLNVWKNFSFWMTVKVKRERRRQKRRCCECGSSEDKWAIFMHF